MQQEIVRLLDRIASHVKSSSEKNLDEGKFNIFSVLGIENREVIICRFLGELLDPNGSHQMGAFPLLCFASQVLGYTSLTEEEAQQAYVCLEERIDDDRRVDIVIHIRNIVWPIEVKIWASDQDAQLCDYYHYYENRYRLDSIYYLTPTGWFPSLQSQGDLLPSQMVCISFVKNIREWLEHILPFCKDRDVRVSIKHFIEVIKKMATTNEQFQLLRTALNIAGDEDMNMDEINAALLLLSHKEELQKEIWKKYIRKNVKCGEGFELIDCEEDDLDVDKYTLLRINHKEKTVAWICVQQNLYMYCKKIKADAKQNWHGTVDSGYQWIHLSPSGRKPFAIRDNSSLKNEDIRIDHILCDIEGVQ